MIGYSIEYFFSIREAKIKPEFLTDIKYVTSEIDDNNKILEVISNNLIIIQKNIHEKTKNKKNYRNPRNNNRMSQRRNSGGSEKPKKFVKNRSDITTKIHVKLNQLCKKTFEKTTIECIEILNRKPEGLTEEFKKVIETELCHILYERIIDGYDYLEMYTVFIRRLYEGLEYGEMLLRILMERIIERTIMIIEGEKESDESEGEEQVMEKKKCMGFLLFTLRLYNQKVIEEDKYIKFMSIIVKNDFLYKIIYERIVYEYEYIELYVRFIVRTRETERELIEELMDIFYEKFRIMIKEFDGMRDIEFTQEKSIIEKKKTMKVVLFIGQLYNNDIVDVNYVSKFINILSSSENIVYIELLCKMIYISHNKLKLPEPMEPMGPKETRETRVSRVDYRDNLAKLIKTRQKGMENNTRIYYEMENVIELQKRNWKNADLKKLIGNSLKGSIKEEKKEKKKENEKKLNISIDELKTRYKNNKLDITVSYSISEESLKELLDELLDECIDQKKEVIKLREYCESLKDRRDIVLRSLKKLEDNKEEIRVDVPDIDDMIRLFKGVSFSN
jgi:hypothetical protein